MGVRRTSSGRRWAVTLSLGVAIAAGACGSAARAAEPDRDRGAHWGRSASATVGLETDAATTPLGIDDPSPRLGWRMRSSARSTMQSAFRVVVRREALTSRDDQPVVWDSGRVNRSTPWVDYAGPALASRTRYSWSVRVWDERGRSSRWSDQTWFETAFMDVSEWQAGWISGPAFTPREGCSYGAPFVRTDCVPPAPRLRTEFAVTKPVARARLYASGLGYGVYFVNDRRVSDAVLDPAISDYSDRAFYVTHDVTSLLRRGDNAVGVELGRGTYGATGFTFARYDIAPWHHDPELRLELHVTYRDGSSAVVRSGPSWKTTDGPTRFDDYMFGETYDARRAATLTGWATPGFDDAAWVPARSSSGPTGRLEAQDIEPIRPQGQLAFRSVKESAPGVYLFDLGVNVAGNVVLDTDLPEGQEIIVRPGEKLRANGRIDNDIIPGLSFGVDLQADHYIGGPGVDRWRPEFSYKGFQYVEVEGLSAKPDPSMLKAEVWHTSVEDIGSFASSNGLLNRIVGNTKRAVLSNLMGQPTDTPIYEKTGYTGDGQLMAAANSYLFDLRRFYAKWTVDIRQSQAPATGELPVWAPSPTDPNGASNDNRSFPGPSPGWDAALFTIPDVLMRFDDDERPARQALEEMKKYRAWYDRNALPNGILVEGCANPSGNPPCANGLGDWANPTGTIKGVTLDNTAWYFYMLGVMEKAAALAGDHATETSAHDRAAQVFAAFQDRFWDPATRTYRNDPGQTVFSQHQNAIALGLGLVPPDRAQSVGEALAADVRARGNHLATGIMGTRFLWHALTMTGHLDEAFAAATQTTYPSYGYWIDTLGWTSLGENWEADARSRNHHMFGTIVQWQFDTLAGYKPLRPGWQQIEYRPMIPTTGLDWLSASTETVRGKVATQWRKAQHGLELDIEVPANATGIVHVPARGPRDVLEVGTGRPRRADDAPGIELVGRDSDRVVYRVGSGTYRFRVRSDDRG